MPVYATPQIGPEEAAALSRIESLRADLRPYTAERRRWVGSVRRVLAARAIQGSNSIEGYHVSVEDALAAMGGDEPVESERADWLAVRSYQRAMTFVLQLSEDPHYRLTPELIRSLHFTMTEHDLASRPGLWRQGPIWVRNDASGDIVYEGPEADQIPGLIDGLVVDLAHGSPDTPVVIRAAMAHLNLVMIHPFSDGNGRMARALQTLILTRDGVRIAEFTSIEEYLGRNTQAYYQVLADVGQGRWNPGNDARPWIRFCLVAHYVQMASVLRRVRESEAIWNELERQLTAAGLPERSLGSLFDAALGLKIRNASYRAVLSSWGEPISQQVATTDLSRMVDAGLLEKHGEKRGTFYIGTSRLIEIRRQLRSRRSPISVDDLFVPPTERLPFDDGPT